MNDNLIKIKLSPEDYRYIVEKIYDKNTGEICLNKVYDIPESMKVPMCYEELEDSYKVGIIRFAEYAAIHYLSSLDSDEREEQIAKIRSIPNPRYGFHTYVTNSLNVPFSMVWDKCGWSRNINDGSIKEDDANKMFNKFYKEHEEEMKRYGITSIDDLGKIVFENLLEYRCDDLSAWLCKYWGIGRLGAYGDPSYDYGDPSISMAVDGSDTIYFKTHEVSTIHFIDKLFSEVFKEYRPDTDITFYHDQILSYDLYGRTLGVGFVTDDVTDIENYKREFDNVFKKSLIGTSRCKITVPNESFDMIKDGIINENGRIDLRKLYPTPEFGYGDIPNVNVPDGFDGDWYQLAALAYLYECQMYNEELFECLKNKTWTGANLVNLYIASSEEDLENAHRIYDEWLGSLDECANPLSLLEFGERVVSNILEHGEYREEDYQINSYGYSGKEITESFACCEDEFGVREVYPEIDMGYGYIPEIKPPKSTCTWFQYALLSYVDSAENKDEILEQLKTKSTYTKHESSTYKYRIEEIRSEKEEALERWNKERENHPELLSLEEFGKVALDNLLKYNTYSPKNVDFHVYGRSFDRDKIKYNNTFFGYVSDSPYLFGQAISKAYPDVPIKVEYDFGDSYRLGMEYDFLNGQLIDSKKHFGYDHSIDELDRKCTFVNNRVESRKVESEEQSTGSMEYKKIA